MVDTDLHYGQGYPSYPQPPKRSHKVLWIALAVLVVVAAVAAVLILTHRQHTAPTQTKSHQPGKTQQQQQPPSSSTTQTPNRTTTKTENTHFSNVLESDDNPTGIKYRVTSGTEPVSGWFIVHVTAQNSYGTFLQIAVLKQAADGDIDAVAGPDTSFPKAYLESENVPAAVINQLPTYNE